MTSLLQTSSPRPIPSPIEPDMANRPRTHVELLSYRLTWAFVGFGLFLRLARYLQRFPLWHDEAFLAVSFLDRGFDDLLKPLEYLQVSPLLFVALELGAVKLLGFSEWSLRLIPALAGMASLLLFRHLACLLLPPRAALLSVAMLAVSYSCLRHGNEVKPYATDLLVSVALLCLAAHAWKSPRHRAQWIAALGLLTPLFLLLSLPAVFVAGAVAIALALAVLARPDARTLAATAAFFLSIALSFGLVMTLSAGTDASEILRQHYLLDYWARSFPPLKSGTLPLLAWLITIHLGNLMAYPVGGEGGASTLTAICALTGLLALFRQRLWVPLVCLLGPFALNILAAFLHRYPYGGEARIAQHLAPAICLLAALGADRWIDRLSSPSRRLLAERALLSAFFALGLGLFFGGVLHPYHIETSARSREFARWFWPSMEANAHVLCIKADLRRDFEPWQWVTGISAEYLCNQRIYSTRPHRPHSRDSVPLPPPTPDRPLRCVLYGVNAYELPWNKPAFRDWVDPLRAAYRLDRIETFHVNTGRGLESWKEERYHVLEFHPRDGLTDLNTPDALDRLLRQDPSPLAMHSNPLQR